MMIFIERDTLLKRMDLEDMILFYHVLHIH